MEGREGRKKGRKEGRGRKEKRGRKEADRKAKEGTELEE